MEVLESEIKLYSKCKYLVGPKNRRAAFDCRIHEWKVEWHLVLTLIILLFLSLCYKKLNSTKLCYLWIRNTKIIIIFNEVWKSDKYVMVTSRRHLNSRFSWNWKLVNCMELSTNSNLININQKNHIITLQIYIAC